MEQFPLSLKQLSLSYLSRPELVNHSGSYFQEEIEKEKSDLMKRINNDLTLIIEAGYPALALAACDGDYHRVVREVEKIGNYSLIPKLYLMAKEDQIDFTIEFDHLLTPGYDMLSVVELHVLLSILKRNDYSEESFMNEIRERNDFDLIMNMKPVSDLHERIQKLK